MAKKGVFLNRETITQDIAEIGRKKWTDFSCSEIHSVGNTNRCDLSADGKKAMLNLFFNVDGSTTVQVCGQNQDISSYVKAKLEEEHSYSSNVLAKTYSFKKLPEEWTNKLISYLSGIENISVEERIIETTPKHDEFTFSSTLGDKLTINRYENGTIVLQGKPAYIFSEALAFMSYCKDVTVDDIIDSINTANKVNISSKEVRHELNSLLPNALSGIDETIVKILSPSITLKKISVDLDDFSCIAFPALRALEAYIKVLFARKSITIGYNFGGIFNGEKLTPETRAKISDPAYECELETLYQYLKSNRHVIFHTEQILVGTKLIEKRVEADAIVNDVLNLIETSYSKLFL